MIEPLAELEPALVAALSERVAEDADELIDLCVQLGNIRSPHGHELPVATEVVDWLADNGIEGWLQPITDGSANAVGLLPGTGEGTSLILNAHLDTGPALDHSAPDRLQVIDGAWIEGGFIYGQGVVNDKGQLGALMMAMRAIKRVGVPLAGDLVLAGTAFETGAPSVGAHQGIDYPGEGFGAWWLVNRGVTADLALVAETSDFGIISTECGEVGVEVRTTGRSVYTPRLVRGSSERDQPGSIVPGAALVGVIEEWARQYEVRETTSVDGGTIVPKAQVISIQGTPSATSIRVDVRLLPGANPRAIVSDLRAYLTGAGMACSVRPYQWSRGHEARGAEDLVAAVTSAHHAVLKTDLATVSSAEISMWRDMNVFNEVGIPSICYGPPRQPESFSDSGDRAMKIADLVAATKVYALTAATLCGPPRPTSHMG